MLKKLTDFTKKAKNRGIYPNIHTIQGPSSSPRVIIDGDEYLSFTSNNYLGLAQREELKNAAKKTVSTYGVGPCSAPLMAGNFEVYERLEKETADFLGFDDTIIYSSGYMANIGVIAPIVNPPYAGAFSFFKKDKPALIISDELNHASIVDGCKLAKTEKIIFSQNNIDELKNILSEHKSENKLLIVEGIYSMDGDISPLDKIVELAKDYNAVLMIDDAHSTGVLGKNGKGTFEHFGLSPSDIDILMGTYVKAFGSVGGFICAKKEIIDYLKISSRSFVFSICITPACAEATIEAIKLLKNEKNLRKELWSNTTYLKSKLNSLGLNTMSSESPIIPVLIGNEKHAIEIEKQLLKNKILIPCIRFPAVEKGKSRLRISVTTSHTKEQINILIDAIEKLNKYFP